jgi:hypothetical protein
MVKAGKQVPEELQQYLPQAQPTANSQEPTADNDLAAVAYALHLAQGKEHKEGIITLPEIHPTAWNHKHYVLK